MYLTYSWSYNLGNFIAVDICENGIEVPDLLTSWQYCLLVFRLINLSRFVPQTSDTPISYQHIPTVCWVSGRMRKWLGSKEVGRGYLGSTGGRSRCHPLLHTLHHIHYIVHIWKIPPLWKMFP